MCESIYSRSSGKEYNSPRRLRELVGPVLLPPLDEPEWEDNCLCEVDAPALLVAAGIAFEVVNGEEYVLA